MKLFLIYFEKNKIFCLIFEPCRGFDVILTWGLLFHNVRCPLLIDFAPSGMGLWDFYDSLLLTGA